MFEIHDHRGFLFRTNRVDQIERLRKAAAGRRLFIRCENGDLAEMT